MSQEPQENEAQFLTALIKDRQAVTIYLRNGVRLQGTIVQQDDYSLLLTGKHHSQLVYKHAIATVGPD